METLNINKIGGIGASEIGALFTQQGLKAKTAQTLAYEKALELINGSKKEFTTIAMQHGIFNEEEAFTDIVSQVFPNAIYQSDISFPIKENVWATPDVIDNVEEFSLDIKCPYSVYTFFENSKKLPAYYVAQNQMQMLATGFNKGFVLLYLTSNVTDEWGNKIEFDIPLNDRHKFVEIEADKEFHKEILSRTDGFFSMRDAIHKDLLGAVEISDMEYFNLGKSDHKITRFKDKSNLLTWSGKIYKNEREGYLVIE